MRRNTARSIRWAARWGFAVLVACGAVLAAWVAWRVDIPPEVPTFALQAAPVYRVEVGAAVFLAAYLASMAVVLALNNRAFSEIGVSGIKAQSIGDGQDRALRDTETRVGDLLRALSVLGADLPADRERG